MLISETTKMTSSAKPKNPCQENPVKDYLNYSTLIPTGWNYNIPPKYMISKCTLGGTEFKEFIYYQGYSSSSESQPLSAKPSSKPASYPS